MFGHFLNPRSFDSPEGFLTYKHFFFPITFGGIKFIPITTITLITYIGSWAFVVSIIVVKFMVDQHPFLFETFAQVNNTFHFQQYFKVTWDLLLPPTCVSSSFEQFIKQQMVQLQDSILEHLHHHTFSSMFSNKIFKPHHVRILWCSSLGVGIWLIIQPMFPTFQLSSLVFSTIFQTQLIFPHLSITNIFQCMCTHPIDLMCIHLLRCAHGNKCTRTHDAICNTFITITQDDSFHMGWE